MEESMKKTRERLMSEFHQASSNDTWTKECIELMKNLLKSIYYIDVINAMEEGNEYPGSEYMPSNSFARGGNRNRNAMGQYTSGDYMDRGSGTYPMYPRMSMGTGYMGNIGSGRMYYSDEMGNVVHKLEHMMNTEMNPEKRMAIQEVLADIKMR